MAGREVELLEQQAAVAKLAEELAGTQQRLIILKHTTNAQGAVSSHELASSLNDMKEQNTLFTGLDHPDSHDVPGIFFQ